MCPNGSSRHEVGPNGKEPVRPLPVLLVALALFLLWPSLDQRTVAWGQTPSSSPTEGTAPPAGGASSPATPGTTTIPPQAAPTTIPITPSGQTAPTPTQGPPSPEAPTQTQGEPAPTLPQQPFYVPQYPSQFPPAFQGPRPQQTQPFGGMPVPTVPGAPVPGAPVPGAPVPGAPVPGAPVPGAAPAGGGPVPQWIPPVAPAPSQAHPPGEIPPGLLTLGAGKLFTFQPTLVVSEMWTDNFNFSPTDKQSDYRTVIGPGANLLINGPTTKGTISGTWGFTYDTAASSSDNFNLFPSLNASIVQIFTPRLSATVTDSYVRNNSPYQSNQFGLSTQRQTFTSNSFSLGINYLIDRIATTVYYRNSYYSTGSSNGSNTGSNIIGASASTPIGVFNTIGLGYEYSWSNTSGTSSGGNTGETTGNLLTATYTRQTGQYSSAGIQGSYQWLSGPGSSNNQSGSQSSGDGQIWNISLFSTYGLPSGLSVSGSLGYSQASGNGQSDQGGVTSNSYVSYSFGRAAVSLGVFSDFQNTGLTGQNFGVVQTQGVTGSLSYTFTPLVTGSVGASYVSNGTTGLGNNSSSPNSNTWNTSVNLNWQVLRWLVMNAQYSYSFWNNGGISVNGNSNSTSGDITVNTVLISLQATF